jgi:hypothetical protein
MTNEEYIAELDIRFLEGAEHVRNAPDWMETSRLMQTLTYPCIVAINRLRDPENKMTHEEIAAELANAREPVIPF